MSQQISKSKLIAKVNMLQKLETCSSCNMLNLLNFILQIFDAHVPKPSELLFPIFTSLAPELLPPRLEFL